MHGFERTRAKRDLYRRVLGDGRYPVQLVWDAHDPTLTTEGKAARRAAGAGTIHTLGSGVVGQRVVANTPPGPM